MFNNENVWNDLDLKIQSLNIQPCGILALKTQARLMQCILCDFF